jgi:hypothetical protein
MRRQNPDGSAPDPVLPSRRDFLKTAGLLTGSALVYGAPFVSHAAEVLLGKDTRRAAAGRPGLELDGAFAGPENIRRVNWEYIVR